MEANTARPSGRGAHSHSTLPLGATSALVSQSDRNAYSAIGGYGLGPSGVSGSNGVWRPTATASPAAVLAALVGRVLAIVSMVCPGSGRGNQRRQGIGGGGQGLPGGPGGGQGAGVEPGPDGLGDQAGLVTLGADRDHADAVVDGLGRGQQPG